VSFEISMRGRLRNAEIEGSNEKPPAGFSTSSNQKIRNLEPFKKRLKPKRSPGGFLNFPATFKKGCIQKA